MKYWLTFVGEGRSGHTIMSAILGSHPQIRLSEEQKWISKWCRGYSKERILAGVYDTGVGRYRASMGLKGICENTGPVLVVGDKCGWDAVNEVRNRGENPDILSRFSAMMSLPVKVIHTSRHPLDNISAYLHSAKYRRLFPDEDLRHRRMIRRYCRFYEAAEEVMQGQDVFHVRNEELIKEPSQTIQNISDWLELPPNRSWRRSAAAAVSSRPHRHRDEYTWIEEYRTQVKTWRVLDRFPSLSYYRGSET